MAYRYLFLVSDWFKLVTLFIVIPTPFFKFYFLYASCLFTFYRIATTRKTPCKYGPVFAPYLHDWTQYGINTVQKRVRIYMAFFLCTLAS